jgi:hypothetical protein
LPATVLWGGRFVSRGGRRRGSAASRRASVKARRRFGRRRCLRNSTEPSGAMISRS